ncbi:Phospholipase [Mycena sanguinolenta]|uniref:Phospholipase n=1 Tax=Mycena sanguinolenta TaxID=230812 RepID=A0A8H6Z1B1_9AGAR|nr:Phospholipase [Mycena sanguinolenta]
MLKQLAVAIVDEFQVSTFSWAIYPWTKALWSLVRVLFERVSAGDRDLEGETLVSSVKIKVHQDGVVAGIDAIYHHVTPSPDISGIPALALANIVIWATCAPASIKNKYFSETPIIPTIIVTPPSAEGPAIDHNDIAPVVEDTDMMDAEMNGELYRVSCFAATLRRKLYCEHPGLIELQMVGGRDPIHLCAPLPRPTPTKRALSTTASSRTVLRLYARAVAYHRAQEPQDLYGAAPWKAYKNYVPKVKTGHLVLGVPLERVEKQLAEVRGALVECPLDFFIDETEFVQGTNWERLDLTFPIYM